jgi:hypothetical protein
MPKQCHKPFDKRLLEASGMRSMQELQQELLIKEIRTAYWQLNHTVPTVKEMDELEEVLV